VSQKALQGLRETILEGYGKMFGAYRSDFALSFVKCTNSAIDLISEAHYLDTSVTPFYLTLVCPVLVVPDLSLWQVKYSDDGTQIGEPEQINHISYYIGKHWTVGDKFASLDYTLSYLEIVTYSEIKNFIEKNLGDKIKLYLAVINTEVGLS
jgi:hypothetical protein